MGGYLLYWVVSGYYGVVDIEEAKLAFATLLGTAASPWEYFCDGGRITDLRKHSVGQLMQRGHIENYSALSSNMIGIWKTQVFLSLLLVATVYSQEGIIGT